MIIVISTILVYSIVIQISTHLNLSCVIFAASAFTSWYKHIIFKTSFKEKTNTLINDVSEMLGKHVAP